ncbi:MAG: sulfate ABC transporter permease subunit CysT [Deltaproteobacteria bacterium]|jgi:sulfate transport system permease protein|nr:sulfate ABC transporter permease subunit CysT [Deltaproteobacteria bacterium]
MSEVAEVLEAPLARGAGRAKRTKKRVIPGFGITMGITMSFVGIIVLVPMLSMALESRALGFGGFWRTIVDARTLNACKVSFFASFVGALVNGFGGLMLAWVIVRYRFPFRRFIDGLIELPFALPTAVAGISLTVLTTDKGWIGKPLFELLGVRVAYTQLGIILAITFVTIPFVVRSVQPVLEQLSPDFEEAGMILGASDFAVFFKIILPEILPALLTGFSLAFARGLGEYGSVIFIAGNIPFKTEIAPLVIMSKLEQFNYDQATAIALVMLAASFAIMFVVNRLQVRSATYAGEK